MFKVIIGVVIFTIATIAVFMAIDPQVGPITTDTSLIVINTNTNSAGEGYFTATVEGEVSRPGSYVLADGSLMADLLEKAGGITDYADYYAFYEDAEISGGTTYYIPSRYDTTNVCQLVEISKVNINTASLEELLAVSVFSTSVANSVISHRAENGEFRTIEGLLDVYGIGNATYRKLRPYVTLHE